MDLSPKLSSVIVQRFSVNGWTRQTFYCERSDDDEVINLLASISGNLLLMVNWLLDDNDPETEISIDRSEGVIKKLENSIEIQYRTDWQEKRVVLDKIQAAALLHMVYSLKTYLLIEESSSQGKHEESKRLFRSVFSGL